MNRFHYVLNAGRSGSTFLWSVLQKTHGNSVHVYHEGMRVQDSLPRNLNRAYAERDFEQAISRPQIRSYLNDIDRRLEVSNVIETGWPSFHMLPIFERWFGKRFCWHVLHRDPLSVAFSRAVLGAYHPRSWYDDANEVSPFDRRSIMPEKAREWKRMNYVERSLFFWNVVYREGDEFAEKCKPPTSEFSLKDLTDNEKLEMISARFDLPRKELIIDDVGKNPFPVWSLETFAIRDEWKKIFLHTDILDYARKRFGYEVDWNFAEKTVAKYRLGSGLIPLLRHFTQFWRVRRSVGSVLRFGRATN